MNSIGRKRAERLLVSVRPDHQYLLDGAIGANSEVDPRIVGGAIAVGGLDGSPLEPPIAADPDAGAKRWEALATLSEVEEVMPPTVDQAVPLYFYLGSAFLDAGQPDQARVRFERVIDSHGVRAWQPIYFIRSHYFLGQAEEQLGNRDAAKAAYQRFLDYWGDGDFDPERVEHARRFVSSS